MNPIHRVALSITLSTLPIITGIGTAFSQVTLVRDGKARAVVVTAVKPSQVATYAVEELVNHVKKATGQQLPVAVETAIPEGYDSRVFVGVSEAARKQGIDADKLEIEHYVLRTVGNDLYIVGKELNPRSISRLASPLFGAVESAVHGMRAYRHAAGCLRGSRELSRRALAVAG